MEKRCAAYFTWAQKLALKGFLAGSSWAVNWQKVCLTFLTETSKEFLWKSIEPSSRRHFLTDVITLPMINETVYRHGQFIVFHFILFVHNFLCLLTLMLYISFNFTDWQHAALCTFAWAEQLKVCSSAFQNKMIKTATYPCSVQLCPYLCL